ncbi:type IV pilin protein [Acinetobacter ursingii]|uniref:type IV pilin protein n=1 Tax=Acinetobacter TaxID=469 RepID=UPI000F674BFD|nr:type IV pilin protein [Acinetobacter sp. FDAARGOS_515]RSC22884.1 prepilin-type N-terminal cleavage/methylation domain-containing protein [Acinetobacter sp. FDAARGOS_515]
MKKISIMTILRNKSFQYGFSLIELMVVIAIVAIFAAIAIPSYQMYVRKADVASAQQEMQRIAEQLSRHKARNFSYKGFDGSYLYKNNAGTLNPNFDSTKQELKMPIDSSTSKYTLKIMGTSTDEKGDTNPNNDETKETLLTDKSTTNLGQSWSIKAESNTITNPSNYDLLITSTGIRCMNKNKAKVTYQTCGTKDEGSEQW